MARVTKGNQLSKLVLQPGWSVEDNGFGLLTCRATYIQSHGNTAATKAGDVKDALKAAPVRGDKFPKDERLTCHRASSSANSNGILVVTAEYVGITAGSMTIPEVTGAGSMSTEPIASHPKFSAFAGTMSSPLNGATFSPDGAFDKFTEHTPPRDKYGVKSYLNAGFSINGTFYTTDIGLASSLKASMGKSSDTGYFNNVNLLGDLSAIGPSWNGVGLFQAENEAPQLLLTGIRLEFYGLLVKVSYDITFATYGWDVDIYPYVNGNYKKGGDTGNKAGNWPTTMHTPFNNVGSAWHTSSSAWVSQ